MDNNDMFLVIVGDDSEELQIPSQIQVKEECIELDESLSVEELIEKAEKYGQYLKLEIQPQTEFESNDDDKSQFTHHLNTIKIENPDNSESDQITSDNEYSSEDTEKTEKKSSQKFDLDEYESNGENSNDHNHTPKNNTKKQSKAFENDKRTYMLSPDEQKSFVEELRNQNPELKNNTMLLVKTLSEIMSNVKRPPLPEHYYVQRDFTFDCPQCGYQSATIPAASRHYWEKHGPRYLVCYACGVDFRSTTSLYKHEKRCKARDQRIVLLARAAILGNKGRGRPYVKQSTEMFQCNKCSQKFRLKSSLMSHIRLHSAERHFQCHKCPAAFTYSSGLARHARKHTDVQYICDHCQKSFKLKDTLIAHMDTHLPIRKFGCDLCDLRFAQKQSLERHVDRVHKNLPPPHACQICTKRYPRMSLLKTHMQKEHGLTLMTPKMLLRRLPTLTAEEMEQGAKVVFKTDSQLNKVVNEDKMNSLDNSNNEVSKDQDIFILPTDAPVKEIVKHYKKNSCISLTD